MARHELIRAAIEAAGHEGVPASIIEVNGIPAEVFLDGYKSRPHPTCLYRHFDSDGRLLYVGISLNAIARLLAHQTSRWFGQIARVEIEHHPTREAALAAELAAIRNEKPLHNVVGRVAA